MVPAVLDRCCFVGARFRDSSHYPRMAVSAADGDGYERIGAGGPNAFRSSMGWFYWFDLRRAGTAAAPRPEA